MRIFGIEFENAIAIFEIRALEFFKLPYLGIFGLDWDVYVEPCQKPKIECFTKLVTDVKQLTTLSDTPS